MSTPAASRPAARQAAVDAVGRRTLDSILEAAASGREDDVLIQLPDGGQLSYRDVLDRRTAYAAALEQRGVQPGNAVAVHMTASPELVLLMFGLYRLGVLAAMSNPVNTVHELRAVLRRSEARLLVVDDDLVSIAASLEADVVVVTADQLAAEAGVLPRPLEVTSPRPAPEAPATMIFTSGTTSEPKGVVYRHGHQVLGAQTYGQNLLLQRDDMLMHHFPLFHMNGLNQLGCAVMYGARVLLLERFRSGLFDSYLDRFMPTATFLNGTHIKMLREVGTTLAQPSPLRRVGMALQMADSDYDWFEQKYGAVLAEGYGLTESVAMCLSNPPVGAKRASCGLPASGYEVEVVAEDGRRCVTGEEGELLVRAASRFGLMDGYHGDREATATALRDGWLHTGDIVRMDEDGFVFYIDRSKDIIKRAGENISAREVENAIEAFRGVRESAVVGRHDALREEVPVAFVVAEDGADVDVDALLDHCRARLAPYKVPVDVRLVATPLPRTAVGKIEKKLLRREIEDEQA